MPAWIFGVSSDEVLEITAAYQGQYYPDYAYNHPLFTANGKIYSDATVSEFINQITFIILLNSYNTAFLLCFIIIVS